MNPADHPIRRHPAGNYSCACRQWLAAGHCQAVANGALRQDEPTAKSRCAACDQEYDADQLAGEVCDECHLEPVQNPHNPGHTPTPDPHTETADQSAEHTRAAAASGENFPIPETAPPPHWTADGWRRWQQYLAAGQRVTPLADLPDSPYGLAVCAICDKPFPIGPITLKRMDEHPLAPLYCRPCTAMA